MTQSKNTIGRLKLFCGMIVTFLGALVITGWFAHIPRIIQLHPSFVPMQFNTALCFFCVGLAILFKYLDKLQFARAAAGISGIIAALTFLQYLFGFDLGIDELFMAHDITTKTSHPGRMAPSTAVCFILANLFILLPESQRGNIRVAKWILSSLLLAIAATSLMGYLLGIESIYGWQKYTRMAAHTAFGFLVVATGLISVLFRTVDIINEATLPWVSAIGTFATFTLLGYGLDVERSKALSESLQKEAHSLTKIAKLMFHEKIDAVSRMAKRAAARSYFTKKNWQNDAKAYYDDFNAIQAIEWSDQNYIVRWIYPLKGNESAQNLNLGKEARRRAALERSRREKVPFITKPINLVQGGKGFLVFAPIFQGKRFNGHIIAVFRIREQLGHVISTSRFDGFNLIVKDGGEVIYDQRPSDNPHEISAESKLGISGIDWTFHLTPPDSFFDHKTNKLPEVVLLFGLLFSGLVAFLVSLFQRNGRAQEKLARLYERHVIALTASRVGVWEWDVKSNSLEWDERMYSLYGVDPKKFEGAYETWQQGVHPEDLERADIEVQEALAGKRKFNTEFRVVWPNGEVRNIHAVADVVHDANGAPARMFGINLDITESRKSERELRASNERYQLMARGASVGIWDWMDVNSDKEFWSPKFYQLLGYDNLEIEASIKNFYDLLHPEDRERTGDLVKRHFEKNIPFDLEYRLKTRSGEYRWFRGSGQVSRDENGNPVQMVGSIQDIHDRVVALEELQRSNRELDQFAYIASHDLQTPLRHVRAFTQKIQEKFGQNVDDDTSRWFRFVDEGTTRMRRMIEDILRFSRVGRGKVDFEQINLNRLFVALQRQFVDEIKGKNIDFRVGGLPSVVANEGLIFQLFQNLISNAIKFRKTEGPLQIFITSKDNEEFVAISVRDNGIGIKQEYRERIFQIFQKLHKTNEFEGTGIGLAMCKKIAELHGGTIFVDGDVDEGSEFTVTLSKNLGN